MKETTAEKEQETCKIQNTALFLFKIKCLLFLISSTTA